MRDVLKRGLRLGHTKAAGVIRRRCSESFDFYGVDFAGGRMVELPIDRAGGHGTGGQDPRPDEVPAVEINGGIGHLTGGYFVWLFHRINHQSNDTERLTEFRETVR